MIFLFLSRDIEKSDPGLLTSSFNKNKENSKNDIILKIRHILRRSGSDTKV
jgi:hypothetical protein